MLKTNDFDLGVAYNNTNLFAHAYYDMADYGVHVNVNNKKKVDAVVAAAGVAPVDAVAAKSDVGINGYYKLGDSLGVGAPTIGAGFDYHIEDKKVSGYQISLDTGTINTFKQIANLRAGGAFGMDSQFEAWVEVDAKIPYVKFVAGIASVEGADAVLALKANFNY